MTTEQLNSAGQLRHLLQLQGLEAQIITDILDRAQAYGRPLSAQPARDDCLA